MKGRWERVYPLGWSGISLETGNKANVLENQTVDYFNLCNHLNIFGFWTAGGALEDLFGYFLTFKKTWPWSTTLNHCDMAGLFFFVNDHIFLLFKAPCSAHWCWCLAACCRGNRWPQRGIMAPIATSFMRCKWTEASEAPEFWPNSMDWSSYNGSVRFCPPVGFPFLYFKPTFQGICL